jgi:hypothetical protein
MISFQANGEQIEHVGQKVAFYALILDTTVIDYFTSLEALKLGMERYQATLTASESTREFELPAAGEAEEMMLVA